MSPAIRWEATAVKDDSLNLVSIRADPRLKVCSSANQILVLIQHDLELGCFANLLHRFEPIL